jgi:phosphoribosylformimino-5-aminoimidazole carboxamide ribotide isomerase
VPVIVGGGVGRLEDIRALKALGVEGVILGRALYEGRLELKEALAAVKES